MQERMNRKQDFKKSKGNKMREKENKREKMMRGGKDMEERLQEK